MVAIRRRTGEPPPVYGPGNQLFSVELHHGGLFVGQGQNRAYIDEKVDWFDQCDTDTWSPLWIYDFVSQLGYENSPALKIDWLLPGKTLADGLRIIVSDADTLVMASIVENVKNFVLYLDYDDNVAGINWDDIVANPIATLPKVLSPKKVHTVAKKSDEKLPTFYANVRTASDEQVYQTVDEEAQVADTEEKVGDGNHSEDSDNDSDFVDSDNELQVDDDDLFADNVDQGVPDEGTSKVKKATGGSTSKGLEINKDGQDLSTDDEGLEVPSSEVALARAWKSTRISKRKEKATVSTNKEKGAAGKKNKK